MSWVEAAALAFGVVLCLTERRCTTTSGFRFVSCFASFCSGSVSCFTTSSSSLACAREQVLISNFTSTLDVFEAVLVAAGLRSKRLDGQMAATKRQECVDTFNSDPSFFAFLLSSKAGGCGINLIGANRLILFVRMRASHPLSLPLLPPLA